jgi:hypothetical protein
MRRGQVLAVLTAIVASVAGAAAGGARDLAGVWDLGSYTELERPAGIASLVMTKAQAEAYEAPRRALRGMLPAKPGEVGQAENEFLDRGSGLALVKGQIRSSTIVDPPDGLLPYTARANQLAGPRGPIASAVGDLDNPETMGGTTRCLATVAAGAPMLGAPDANVIQLVQTKDHLAILSEKYHDVRIVRLFRSATEAGASGRAPPAWLGHSVGWWEGDTLVVKTEGFRAGVINKGQRLLISGDTRVTERLTKIGPGEIFYAFTVEDPALLTRPWQGEQTIRAAKGKVFEYACHEGNYSMGGMLAGARREERETGSAGGAK